MTKLMDIMTGGRTHVPGLEASIVQLTVNTIVATQALQAATDLLEVRTRQFANHEHILAHDDIAGHFKAGFGFEYDEATGKHNVTATADFKEALEKALTDLKDNELTNLDTRLTTLSEKMDVMAARQERMTWQG